MKFLFCLWGLLFWSQLLRAQEEPAFVKSDQPGMILGLLEFPTYSFYLGAPDINGKAYVPNFSPRLGAAARWRSLGLALSFGLPLPSEEVERRGNSQQSSFVLTRYWRNYGVDAYYQDYRGFYLSNPLTELDLNKPSRFPQLPDSQIRNYGVNFYQVLDSSRYSLSSSFDFEEIQMLDGGSWLVTGFYNHLEMSLGSRFIPGSDPNDPQTVPNLQSGAFDSLGGGGGYGYTWIYQGWFLTAQGIVGLGLQRQSIEQIQGESEQHWSPVLKANLNLAAGANLADWVFGGKLLVDSLTSNVSGIQVYSSLVNGLLYFGTRF